MQKASLKKTFETLKKKYFSDKFLDPGTIDQFLQDTNGLEDYIDFDLQLSEKRRKKTGSYYTPFSLCSFMIEQGIINMVNRTLFVKISNIGFPNNIVEYLSSLSPQNLLSSLSLLLCQISKFSVLDPALGTGNFLIAYLRSYIRLLKSIFNIILTKINNRQIIIEDLFSLIEEKCGAFVGDIFKQNWISIYNKIKSYEDNKDNKSLDDRDIIIASITQLFLLNHFINYSFGIDIDENVAFISKLRFLYEWKNNYPEIYTQYMKEGVIDDFTPKISVKNYLLDTIGTKKDNFSKIDLIIGNPPYGNILSDSEKSFTKKYCDYVNDISNVFICRSISYCMHDIIFITSYAICFHKKFSTTRKNLIDSFSKIRISTFDRDKCYLFNGMTQSVSIVQALNNISNEKENKTQQDIDKDSYPNIKTSKMFRVIPEYSSIKYSQCFPFFLSSKNGLTNQYLYSHRLPKMGENHFLITFLSKFDHRLKEIINKKVGKEIWYRSSGNYWYNAWDKKPYSSSEIKSLFIIPGFEDFILCVINSQLFYIWLRVYGDGRHLNKDILENFPIPSLDTIKTHHLEIKSMKNLLMENLFGVFDSKYNRFETSKIKHILDKNDFLLAKIYKFPKDKEDHYIDHILNYDKSIHGGRKI